MIGSIAKLKSFRDGRFVDAKKLAGFFESYDSKNAIDQGLVQHWKEFDWNSPLVNTLASELCVDKDCYSQIFQIGNR